MDGPVFEKNAVTLEDSAIQSIIANAKEKGEQVSVYKWEIPPTPVEKAIPVDQIVETINCIRLETLSLISKNPDWDNSQIQDELCKNSTSFDYFAKVTHPHLFKMVADKHATETNIRRLFEMLSIRKFHETSTDSDEIKTREITSFFESHFSSALWNTGLKK